MVANPRTAKGADRLRPLNAPRPLRVEADEHGLPLRLGKTRPTQKVTAVLERWRIDEEWWRDPISRLYYQVELEDGQALQVMGKCLDAPANATGGTRVQIWDCNGGTNQRWTLNTNGTISNAQSGLCLDVNNGATANGTAVILWSCHGGTNQRWTRS